MCAQHWGRVPALGTHPTFIADLASMVLEKLPSAAPRPGYLASPNENINLGPPSGARSLHAQHSLLPCSHVGLALVFVQFNKDSLLALIADTRP